VLQSYKTAKGKDRITGNLLPTRKPRVIIYSALGMLLFAISGWLIYRSLKPASPFNAHRAFQDVASQVAFGPRTPGSAAHAQVIAYIQKELVKAGWAVQIQSTEWLGFSVQNIIATRTSATTRILIGAHYDSRLLADQDTGPGRNQPVPGANDGASGVAILLELARTLPSSSVPVSLVFFDAEDSGGLDNRQWIMGSQAYVKSLTVKPQAAIIVDMVGDANLNIYEERNSNPNLTAEIWAQAAALGYGKFFIPTLKYDMIDDHSPFLAAGIPAVDIIDFDFPYWHTSADTLDKVSAQSLQTVGGTLWAWIVSQK
jgi:glutaminyl-peptide cyclotransferase